MDRFFDENPVQLHLPLGKGFRRLTVCLEASVLPCVKEHGVGGIHAYDIGNKRHAQLQKVSKYTGSASQVRELAIPAHFQMSKSLGQHPVPVATG